MKGAVLEGAARWLSPALPRLGGRPVTVGLADLVRRFQAWDGLAAGALNPSPFYMRPVVMAHVAHEITPEPGFVVAERDGELLGLWPVASRSRAFGWTGRVRTAWTSPFVTSSRPLVRADRAEEAVALLLDGLAAAGERWLLPELTLDDRLGALLLHELRRRDWPYAIVGAFERPVFRRRPAHVGAAAMPAGRRKDLGRRLRRLEEAGRVGFASATDGDDLVQAVEAFLALEGRGWKGRRGTALASRSETAAFARALFRSKGLLKARADILGLDGEPIAVSLALVSGGTAYLLKTAYDERFARSAPGLLLEQEIAEALHRERFADSLNSATGPNSPLAGLFPDRESVADLIVSTRPTEARRLPALARQEEQRRRLVGGLKRRAHALADRWRGQDRTLPPLAERRKKI